MPTKRMFDMAVMTWVGMKLAWCLPKLWAHRTNAEPGTGLGTTVARAVTVAA